MPIQDAFGAAVDAMPLALPGMIAEGQQVKDVASKRVTTAPVAFGLAVVVMASSTERSNLAGRALKASPSSTRPALATNISSAKWPVFCARARFGSQHRLRLILVMQ